MRRCSLPLHYGECDRQRCGRGSDGGGGGSLTALVFNYEMRARRYALAVMRAHKQDILGFGGEQRPLRRVQVQGHPHPHPPPPLSRSWLLAIILVAVRPCIRKCSKCALLAGQALQQESHAVRANNRPRPWPRKRRLSFALAALAAFWRNDKGYPLHISRRVT